MTRISTQQPMQNQGRTARFQNRTEAGRKLAHQLRTYANYLDVIVLGLPRGGVPVAFEVAKALNAPLDVLVVRKLGVPDQPELAMGAIAAGGIQVLNQALLRSLSISEETIQRTVTQEYKELERRKRMYRGARPTANLRDLTVILVDDGLATGASMQAAIEAVRHQKPTQIVVAVPVAAPETYRWIKAKVDEVICTEIPQQLQSIGYFYNDFSPTTDEEVCEFLRKSASP